MGDLSKLGWIPGKENVADDLTKEVLYIGSPFGKLLSRNKPSVGPIGWADVTP